MLKRVILFFIIILIFPVTLLLSKMEFKPKSEYAHVPTRNEQPKDTEIMTGAIPIHYWKTTAGTDVYFVPTEQLPIVDLYITFDAGSARDGDYPGLAGLCSSLLEEGTTQFTADQIAEQFENVGAEFNTKVTRDRMIITLRSLSDESIVTPVVDLVAEIIAHANFNETSIDQIKKQTIQELKQNNREPDIIAYIALYNMLYPNHPYGHLISGTVEGINKIQRENLIDFYKKYFVAKNATITIVGGIHRDLARDLSNKVMQKLEVGNKAPILPSVQALTQAEEKRISSASKQTHMLLGSVFNPDNENDYYALQLGNYILGEGPLVARLFKELRDKRGFTYNIGSIIRRLSQGGSFIMYMQTKNSVAFSALKEAQKTIKLFVEGGPLETEVEDAKRGMIGAFALSIGNNDRIADTVAELTFYKLPLSYLNQYPTAIRALTREKVHETFKKYIQPDKMALVIVGENVQ